MLYFQTKPKGGDPKYFLSGVLCFPFFGQGFLSPLPKTPFFIPNPPRKNITVTLFGGREILLEYDLYDSTYYNRRPSPFDLLLPPVLDEPSLSISHCLSAKDKALMKPKIDPPRAAGFTVWSNVDRTLNSPSTKNLITVERTRSCQLSSVVFVRDLSEHLFLAFVFFLVVFLSS